MEEHERSQCLDCGQKMYAGSVGVVNAITQEFCGRDCRRRYENQIILDKERLLRTINHTIKSLDELKLRAILKEIKKNFA